MGDATRDEPDGLQRQLDEAQRTVKTLQDELDATSRGLIAMAVELERKKEEVQATTAQLWQAGKLASVGELAASVAHELNNPLTAITLWTEKLMMELPPGDPRKAGLEVIDQEALRMARLVRNLLQFCRRGTTQRSTLKLAEELDGTLDLVEQLLVKGGVRVVRDYSPESPLVQGDRQHLRQVFLNLLTNASDAMPKGGVLTIRVQPFRDADPARESAMVEFVDTGVGIPPDLLKRVLEPFFTTKSEGKGTGLGLSICRRIVAEHGGRIEIQSVVGEGTSVRVILPRSGVPVAPLPVA